MSSSTLIIGSGACARQVARLLTESAAQLVIAACGEAREPVAPARTDWETSAAVEYLPTARLVGCRGFAGGFDVVLEDNGERFDRRVTHIVIAMESMRRANFDGYGLKQSPQVRALSTFRRELAENRIATGKLRVVFLHGLLQESVPSIANEVMRTALALQSVVENGSHTFLMTGNLKVAGNGLEALSREVKAAGVMLYKFAVTTPQVRRSDDGEVTIEFTDEVTGQPMHITPDIVVVDESPLPSPALKPLAALLGLHTDPAGFLQTDNVHRLPVFSNRRGIFVIGAARGIMTAEEASADATNAALCIQSDAGRPAAAGDVATVHEGQCIRCLTCFRLCPYNAISKANRIRVHATACAGCGICAAECPRGAVRLDRFNPEIERLIPAAVAEAASGSAPAILAFCCSRSAARAAEMAYSEGRAVPENLRVVEVPCAGGLATGHILDAFAAGSAGVLVLTCHSGNCHSETGNLHASDRVSLLRDQLGQLGMDERLQLDTLAANMGHEFADMVLRFAEKIRTLGPLKQR